jgi:uncharacterized protein
LASTPRLVAGLLVMVLLAGTIIAGGYLLLRPSPNIEETAFPTLEYYATDLAGAMSEDDIYYINQLCFEVDASTSCEMAVLVVNTTHPSDINYYALRTFQHNTIGKAGSDNGLLVVIAIDDRAWRVEVGYGLEGVLTDVRVKHLAEEFLVPNMTTSLYGDGLFELTYALGTILETEYEGTGSGDPAFPVDGVPLTGGQWALVIVVFVVLCIVTRRMVVRPLVWLLVILTGGRGGFGGGRSGGGGASGKS